MKRTLLPLLTLAVLLGASLLGPAAALLPPRLAQAATTTYLNETFDDHANNWNISLAAWGRTANGHFSNCAQGCDTGISRAWLGIASNSRAYTIDADIFFKGAAECKVIYANAHRDENWRVDLMRSTNRVRLSAPFVFNNTASWIPPTPIVDQTQYHLTISLSRSGTAASPTTSISVSYQKAGETTRANILALNVGGFLPDGKIGIGAYGGGCEFDNVRVTGEEGIGAGASAIIPIFGYERTEACDEGPINAFKDREPLNETQCDRPLFSPWNRDDPLWWNDMVEELDHANIGIVAAHNRGCSSTVSQHGEGDMCPRLLSGLITAIQSRGSPLKIAMFDDLPTASQEYVNLNGGARFDAGNQALWQSYLWDRRWNIFYQAIPADRRALVDGRPLIFVYDEYDTLFTNQQGNFSRMFSWLRQKTIDTYGFNPIIVVSTRLVGADTTLSSAVDGVFSWYAAPDGTAAPPAGSYAYKGTTIVPSVRLFPNNTGPGCGSPCGEISRAHGNTLLSALEQQKGTRFVLLEGWTNVVESAGYYRSLEDNDPHGCTAAGDQNAYDYPNQTLNIVQRYSNPGNGTVVLEAETADDYSDTTQGNDGHFYRPPQGGCTYPYNDLDIGYDSGTYFVGWVAPNESIGFRDVYLQEGTYAVKVRYATPQTDAELCVQINAAPESCNLLPATGSWTAWRDYSFPAVPLHRGLSNVQVTFRAGWMNLDKLTLTRGGSFNGNFGIAPASIPGTIQAEDFDNGGEGQAYHDTTLGNYGEQYRVSDVDIEASGGGGYDVGWTAAGEWLQYSVDVGAAGTYDLALRVASDEDGGNLHVNVDGANVSGSLHVPDTGGWQTYTTLTKQAISLSAGRHTLRLVLDSTGVNGYVANVDSLTFTARSTGPAGGSAPLYIYPVDGQTLDYVGNYLFKVQPVANAQGYLWGFFQGGTMVWENLRDEGQLSSNDYGIMIGTAAHARFSPGQVQVWCRALVNNAWTDAGVITITLR